jgi:hypothetical protein
VTGAVHTLTFLAKFINQSYDEKWAAIHLPCGETTAFMAEHYGTRI